MLELLRDTQINVKETLDEKEKFYLGNVSKGAIAFWASWNENTRTQKKSVIRFLKETDDEITSSETKLIATLDTFLEKHFDVLMGKNRNDVALVIPSKVV